jgi:TonB family protein
VCGDSVISVKSQTPSPYAFLVLATVISFLSLRPIVASTEDFGDALARQITDAKIYTLALAEFVTQEGESSPRGSYLAARLAENWSEHHAELVVVKPANFTEALAAQNLTLQALNTPEPLKQIGNTLGVEALMFGTVKNTVDGYLLTVTVRTVSDGALVLKREQPIGHSRVLDSLASTDVDTTASASSAGVNGVGMPVCNYMPTPIFPTGARKAKVSAASAALLAVITPQGRPTNIRVTKDPGYGFAERAVEALTEWRCKPALDKDKKPTAVTVPIEITFRDY